MPASCRSYLTTRVCSIWEEESTGSQLGIVYGRGIVRTISTLVPLSLRRRCWTSLLMVAYIVYSIWDKLCRLVWTRLSTKSLDQGVRSCLWFGRCYGTSTLADIEFYSSRRTMALQLYETWCLWAFGYRSFREMEPWEILLMVKYCKELEHLWCASRRSVYRGICRWLRSWLACIAELAGYSRLDENQFDLRTFGSLLILSLGDLYFKQLGIVLTTLRKVELETWNRVYQLRHRLKGVVSRSSELN